MRCLDLPPFPGWAASGLLRGEPGRSRGEPSPTCYDVIVRWLLRMSTWIKRVFSTRRRAGAQARSSPLTSRETRSVCAACRHAGNDMDWSTAHEQQRMCKHAPPPYIIPHSLMYAHCICVGNVTDSMWLHARHKQQAVSPVRAFVWSTNTNITNRTN